MLYELRKWWWWPVLQAVATLLGCIRSCILQEFVFIACHWCRGPIKWRSSLKNTIYDVLESKKEWVETESETDWDFFWADKG